MKPRSSKRAAERPSDAGSKLHKTARGAPADTKPELTSKGGLDVEVHPLLRELAAVPTVVKKGSSLHNGRNIHELFNPYIEQTNRTSAAVGRRRALQINAPGKFIAEANEQRAKEAEERRKIQVEKEMHEKGILPGVNTQETLFRPSFPPLVEWWDMPYVRTWLYRAFFEEKKEYYLDDEQALVSIYVQHPAPVDAADEPVETKVYLTPEERRRKRRNERQMRHKEKQDRIKLGLDLPPAPKVKLANLMNVLTDEAIKDPTAVERRVRREIKDRYDKHMAENEARKPSKEQKMQQREAARQRDLQKGLVTAVYKIKSLEDGQQFFKVDMNAKQLGLLGIALINPRFCLVIVEGGAKSVRFLKKLMTRRIQWDKRADGQVWDNSCVQLWEGELKEPSFRKWSPMYTNNDEEAYQVLKKFGHENYWRQAFNESPNASEA